MFITFADLAKLKGVSRSAVSQRRRTGILKESIVKVNGKEMLNKDLALELWEKNSVPAITPLPVQTKKELKKDNKMMLQHNQKYQKNRFKELIRCH